MIADPDPAARRGPAPADGQTPVDLSVVVQDAFVATLHQRGADLAADRLSALDADQAWDAYFGPLADRIQETLAPGLGAC